MTAVILLGIGVGLGVLSLVVAVRPRSQTLHAQLRILNVDPSDEAAGTIGISNLQGARRDDLRSRARARFGELATMVMDLVPSFGDECRRDLRSAGWTSDTLAERCVLSSLVGALLPFVAWALLSLRGIGMPLVLPIWVGLIGASVGAAFPVLVLRGQAKAARRQARRMVGCFLDLVVLALAGGLGIEGALHAAAAIGDTQVSNRMARCLDEARDAGRTSWEALERLGHELVVPELVELALAVSLAGTEGARIKSTLAAKAASIRRHELADAESDANTISDRLFIPGVLLLIGFLIFIGYPAVARLTAGL